VSGFWDLCCRLYAQGSDQVLFTRRQSKKSYGYDGLVGVENVRGERNLAVCVWVRRNRASTYSEHLHSLWRG
jgi:hypothetical protein